jgi:energy-converting hydrogenase Eha subunit B
MTDTVYYPYLGSGKIYARTAGAAAPLLDLGNASKLEIVAKDKKVTMQDFSKHGGGTYASVSRIDSVTLNMTLNDLNKKNVAMALFGTDSAVDAGNVVDDVVTAYKGGLTPLAHPGPTSVVVKDATAGTTYTANTDYEVRAGGIYIIPGGAITDGARLKVDYAYGAYGRVEAMTSTAVIMELHFEGLNEANSGSPVIVDIYRAQLSPAKALSLLGDKFADLQIDAEALVDNSKTGVGISKYFRVKLA